MDEALVEQAQRGDERAFEALVSTIGDRLYTSAYYILHDSTTAEDATQHELDTDDVRPWWWARWSPDGSRIIFGTERLQPSGAIWTIRPDGSDLSNVFEDSDGRFVVGPIWSPDGTMIMFVLHPNNDVFDHDTNEIYVINADGTGLQLVVGGHAHKSVADWWE